LLARARHLDLGRTEGPTGEALMQKVGCVRGSDSRSS
jgi:hypothetical protein